MTTVFSVCREKKELQPWKVFNEQTPSQKNNKPLKNQINKHSFTDMIMKKL